VTVLEVIKIDYPNIAGSSKMEKPRHKRYKTKLPPILTIFRPFLIVFRPFFDRSRGQNRGQIEVRSRSESTQNRQKRSESRSRSSRWESLNPSILEGGVGLSLESVDPAVGGLRRPQDRQNRSESSENGQNRRKTVKRVEKWSKNDLKWVDFRRFNQREIPSDLAFHRR